MQDKNQSTKKIREPVSADGTANVSLQKPRGKEQISDKIRAAMFEDSMSGMSIQKIADKYGINKNTVVKYKAVDKWAAKHLMVRAREEFLRSADIHEIMEGSFRKTLNLLYKVASDAEQGYTVIDSDTKRKIPLKTLMDCIEKAGKYYNNMKNEGVIKSEIRVKKEVIDWTKAIELATKTKKENPGFDEMAFQRAIVNSNDPSKD